MAERYQLQWTHATEQAWIVDAIAEAILGWSGAAAGGPHGRAIVTVDGEASAPQVHVTFASNQKLTLTVDHHIWSPATYVPLAAAALGGTAASRPPDGPIRPSSLEALTNPLPEVTRPVVAARHRRTHAEDLS
jgi:hypothetical protein